MNWGFLQKVQWILTLLAMALSITLYVSQQSKQSNNQLYSDEDVASKTKLNRLKAKLQNVTDKLSGYQFNGARNLQPIFTAYIAQVSQTFGISMRNIRWQSKSQQNEHFQVEFELEGNIRNLFSCLAQMFASEYVLKLNHLSIFKKDEEANLFLKVSLLPAQKVGNDDSVQSDRKLAELDALITNNSIVHRFNMPSSVQESLPLSSSTVDFLIDSNLSRGSSKDSAPFQYLGWKMNGVKSFYFRYEQDTFVLSELKPYVRLGDIAVKLISTSSRHIKIQYEVKT